MKDEDASVYGIKALAVLIRCLGVLYISRYDFIFTLTRKFVLFRSHSRNTKNTFCKLYSIYTWKSVRSLHLVFHQMAINDRVNNPENWSRIDTSLENARNTGKPRQVTQ